MATEPDYASLSDAALLALEERMYDDEVEGNGDWFERDKVLWEINARKNRSSPPSPDPGTGSPRPSGV